MFLENYRVEINVLIQLSLYIFVPILIFSTSVPAYVHCTCTLYIVHVHVHVHINAHTVYTEFKLYTVGLQTAYPPSIPAHNLSNKHTLLKHSLFSQCFSIQNVIPELDGEQPTSCPCFMQAQLNSTQKVPETLLPTVHSASLKVYTRVMYIYPNTVLNLPYEWDQKIIRSFQSRPLPVDCELLR